MITIILRIIILIGSWTNQEIAHAVKIGEIQSKDVKIKNELIIQKPSKDLLVGQKTSQLTGKVGLTSKKVKTHKVQEIALDRAKKRKSGAAVRVLRTQDVKDIKIAQKRYEDKLKKERSAKRETKVAVKRATKAALKAKKEKRA